MEASAAAVAPPIADHQDEVEAAVAASHPSEPAALNASQPKMFRYSAYLHVGPGADQCEHREDGECVDPEHFHAWCRLPNKFQHRDLYTKATAAKARRLRQLQDESSDAREVLESEIDAFRGDAHIETIIDDLLKAEWAADYVNAVKEVGEREEYEHISADRERFVELGETEAEKPADEQSEEFLELTRHIAAWSKAIADELGNLQEPKRQAMRDMGREQLIDQLRQRRMGQVADQLYLHVYNQWEWFICTMQVKKNTATGRPFERYWQQMGTIEDPEPGSMWSESPEVIDALQVAYDELERALQAGVQGNS